ncbi:MAG: DUF362 domain-containing protein, partial [Spirochaetota bacterium]
THPAVVGALCRLFAEHGCSVTIGESSAFYQGGGTAEGFITSGMAAVAEKYGAQLLDFETTEMRKITSGQALNPFYITEAVFEYDLVVDCPKLKLHRLARYTGALKNLYGCIPGGAKQIYHMLFQGRDDYQQYWGEAIADVYEAVSPALCVMDAVVGLDRDGPAANGEPRQTGVILASTNGAALDIAACRMIGFDPLWVPAVKAAVDRGYADPQSITVKGDLPELQYVKLPDAEKKTGLAKKLDDYMFEQLIVEPQIDRSLCTKCGKCISCCAPCAIAAGRKGFPEIDYSKCIYCYGCSHYCPYKAITLHGGIVNHLIRAGRALTGI